MNGLPDAFYVRDAAGDLVPTEATRGPWNVDHQHGGPPSALLAGAIERHGDDAASFVVVRVTVELLAPIEIATPLRVEVGFDRQGKTAQRLSATLSTASGRLVARAMGLRIKTQSVALPEPPRHPPLPPLPPPEDSPRFSFPFFTVPVGYHTSVDLRIARGTWGQGPCAGWIRPLLPLVRDEPTSGLQRTVIAADAGNGVGVVLDPSRYAFVNPDLTIALSRRPEGEWIGLDAHAVATDEGVGLCDCVLHDRRGAMGRCLQTLVVRAMPQ